MPGQDPSLAFGLERRHRGPLAPGPAVAEDELGDQVQKGALGAAVVDRDPEQDVVGGEFGELDLDVEVAVVVEDARVDQLELGVLDPPAAGFVHQACVGKLGLRVLVEHPHVRVRRRTVEEVVVLLHIFAVVSLFARDPEQALLQDGIAPVPERETEAYLLLVVAEARDAVFSPPVGTTAGMVVREVVPGVADGAVVLAYRAPLPLGQVGAPRSPFALAVTNRLQPTALCVHVTTPPARPRAPVGPRP